MKKFDYVVGNPPYQAETTDKVSTSNGQTPKTNVFHYFQIAADQIANKATVMIYPAGRWIHQSGKGLAAFGAEQINDVKLKKIILYADAKEIFRDAAIADGVGVVIKETKKTEHGFEYTYHLRGQEQSVIMDNPGSDLMPLNPNGIRITEKTKAFMVKYGLKSLHDRILPRTLFGIESDCVEKNPSLFRPYSEKDSIDYSKEVKVFTNDKAGKAGRAKWFVANKKLFQGKEKYLKEWQVVVSSANAGGQKRDNQIEIIDNHSAFGRARVALGSFTTEEEAKHFYLYCNTFIVRYLFLMTDEALTSLGKQVFDFPSYQSGNSIINYDQNIDEQLCRLIGFTEDEMEYIIQTVKGVRSKGKVGDENE